MNSITFTEEICADPKRLKKHLNLLVQQMGDAPVPRIVSVEDAVKKTIAAVQVIQGRQITISDVRVSSYSISSPSTFVPLDVVAPSNAYYVGILRCYNPSDEEEAVGVNIPAAGKTTTGFTAYPTASATLEYFILIA